MFGNNKIKELESKIKELESLVEYQNGIIEGQCQLCERLVKFLQDETFKLSKEIERKKKLKNKPLELIATLEAIRDHNRMICNRVAENNFTSKG